jgi:hypothetical protein
MFEKKGVLVWTAKDDGNGQGIPERKSVSACIAKEDDKWCGKERRVNMSSNGWW